MSSQEGPIIPHHIEETAAVVWFTDTSGDVALDATQLPPTIPDFDEDLTRPVRSGRPFPDGRGYRISAWPGAASYGLVLVDDLRDGQADTLHRLENLRRETEPDNLPGDFEDRQGRAERAVSRSLGSLVTAVANHAPRSAEHLEAGRNGADFWIGKTGKDNTAFVGQLPYFEQLEALGRLTYLGRVPEETAHKLWLPNEQFRSSVVGLVPELDRQHLDTVFDYESIDARRAAEEADEHPEVFQDAGVSAKIAWVDTFLNVRLLVANQAELVRQIQQGADFRLFINDEIFGEKIQGGTSLGSAENGTLTLYRNPSDPAVEGPGYMEFARPVDDPTNVENSALAAIVNHLDKDDSFKTEDLADVVLDFKPV